MSLPISNPHPLASLSGLWFMAGDRAKKAIAHVAETYRRIGVPEASQVDADDLSNGVRPIDYSVINGVATIPVVGTLTKYPLPEPWMDVWCGTCPALAVKAALDAAMNDARVKSVVLVIDSPGGLVAGTSELVDTIAAYRVSQPGRPIHAAITDCAASGGYYIASQCTRVTCNAMGEVGCIGVYAVLVDDSKFWGDKGVTFTVVSSGGVKGMGADGVVSEDLIADQQRGVDAMYMKFVADIATGRGMSIEQAMTVGTGQTWLAAEAMGKKLIDAVENVDEAINALTAAANKQIKPSSSKTIGSPAPQAGRSTAVTDGRSDNMADSAPTGDGQTTVPDDTFNDADVKFLNDMIAHHKAGVEMAKAIDSAGQNDDVKQLAEAIVTTQTAEIDQMSKLLDESGKTSVVAPADTMPAASATLPDLILACDGDKAAAADYAIAGMSVAQATAAYGIVKSARAESASKDQKIAQLEYAAGGQKSVGTTGGASVTGGGTPEAQAKSEWSKNDKNCQQTFISEAVYVASRKRELAAA